MVKFLVEMGSVGTMTPTLPSPGSVQAHGSPGSILYPPAPVASTQDAALFLAFQRVLPRLNWKTNWKTMSELQRLCKLIKQHNSVYLLNRWGVVYLPSAVRPGDRC